MVFNLCSSAGVHGVLVLLFFAGGPMVGEAMSDSSAPTAPAALDVPDIVRADGPDPDVRLLVLRDPDGEVSNLTEASVVDG
jgi:hypothetical protein